ncbi:Uma2 family endonuclease [Sphaerospermopsis aphanizomenoides BCCUSP55]|uniref:Uma2 family endonuclease n=1 Tax=Sphaerospermopsis aphanizomenoides TaxID=459663 RepID=UPI0019039A14|nr:Uma2 family endonuclease [Sphaerospermopsis aphanizomenoides]MBK1990094.1 Uma2 family endonuclease [Sphaerospermopsis aphanizomenoides BCCUSP55]
MGIKEYWIVDYRPYGATKFVGNPKKARITVFSLIKDEYQINHFRSDDRVMSLTFPELSLTANQILLAGD